MATDRLPEAIRSLPPPWRGEFRESVGSTQDEARRAAGAGVPARSVFVADHQSAGRGRHGRVWLAAPGEALLVSFLLRETGRAPRPWRSTALASVAMAEAIEHVVPSLRVTIKWPNDLMVRERKVAGILAESSWDGQHLVVIVGVGVNVNLSVDALAAIGAPAISLRVASDGAAIDRGALLLAYVAGLERWLARPEAELQATWHARLWGRQQRVRLADLGTGEVEEVIVLGAEPDGALRVRRADGTERITTTGELIL